MTPEQLQRRIDLAACYRLAHRFGFSDIVWNHITARVPGADNRFLMLRFGLRYDEVRASNLVELDGEGPGKSGDGDGIGMRASTTPALSSTATSTGRGPRCSACSTATARPVWWPRPSRGRSNC